MKKNFLKVIILFFVFLPCNLALADGGFIPYYPEPSHQDLYEPSQTALIVYDKGEENLYLKVNYEGKTNRFVWIVPTPHYPEVEKAPDDIFSELSVFTQRHWALPEKKGLNYEIEAGSEQNVIVHEEKQVGIYKITILSATGAGGLFDWLNSNGYSVSEEVREVLDWYVKKEWYFTAMKVEPEEGASKPENVSVYSDYIEPIKISFATRAIVYPLKISQISTKVPEEKTVSLKTSEVLLYVLADREVKGPKFNKEYAEQLSPEIIQEAEHNRDYDFGSLQKIVDKEFFLTKMRRKFAKKEMNEDIYFIYGDGDANISDYEIIPLLEDYQKNNDYFEAKSKVSGSTLSDRLKGRIVLKVEDGGKAYYINPRTKLKKYLGRPQDAFAVMREQSLGIANNDLAKIQISTDSLSGHDTDSDGLPDAFEDAIGTDKNKSDTDGDGNSDKKEVDNGYNPNGQGKLPYDYSFAEYHKGKIFLQVEGRGEAWYVNPVNGKRYFLGRPVDAFAIMRNLGLGITNKDFDVL